MRYPALLVLALSLSITSLWNTAQADDIEALIDSARSLPAQAPEKERRYRSVLELSPSNPRALFNLALLLQANRRYAEAVPLYREVLEQNPADGIAHYNLANVLIALDDPGNWQSSAWHLRQAIFYTDNIQRIEKANAALDRLESNLDALYTPYRTTHYSSSQLINILDRIDPVNTVRGNSKYDGPRIPLMLNFSPQSDALTPTARKKLDAIAAILKSPELQDARIQIEGYTDSHEHPEFEQRMRYARQRAERVRQYFLQQHKLPAGRFTIRAFADLEIISANNTPEGRAANRRVELYNPDRGRKIPAPLHDN